MARRLTFQCLHLSLRQPVVQAVRTVSARSVSTQISAPKDDTIQIGDALTFRLAQQSHQSPSRRPLVLMYSWLGAEASHLNKYGDVYLGKGYDVLQIRVKPQQFLWSPTAHKVVDQVTDFITEDVRRDQPILIHGFSVGGYMYGETLVKFKSEPQRFSSMRDRIKGQIFDSIVTVECAPRGVSKSITNNVVLQRVLRFTVESYMKIFSRWFTKHLWRSSVAFHENPLRTPGLWLYSKADVVASLEGIENMIRIWSAAGVPAYHKCWDNSPHVLIYRNHPDEYLAAVNKFLTAINLEPEVRRQTSTDDEEMDRFERRHLDEGKMAVAQRN